MANKKICFLIDSVFEKGKEQRNTTMLANALIDKKIDVTLIIKYKEDVDYNVYNLSKEVKIIKLDYKKKKHNILRFINRKIGLFKKNTKKIKKFYLNKKILNDLEIIFYENKYDLVVGVSGDNSFILSSIKDKISSKIVYWNYNSFDEEYINKKTKYYNEEEFIKPLFKNIDKVVCFNEEDVNKFKKNYKVDSIMINDLKSFETKEETKFTSHKFMTICDNKKDIDHVLELMNNFHKDNKKFKLDIYGKYNKKCVISRINKYKADKYIKYNLIKDDLRDIYLKHDVYLDISTSTFEVIVLDALESGLPVISFNSNLVIDDVNGRLAKDDNEYVNCMIEICKDKKNLNRYQKAINRTIKNYSASEVSTRWIDIIKK